VERRTENIQRAPPERQEQLLCYWQPASTDLCCEQISKKTNAKQKHMILSNRACRILASIALTIMTGLLGQWSYIASWIRSTNDCIRTGGFTTHPRLVIPQTFDELIHGLSWKVTFYKGAFNFTDLIEHGFGLSVVFGLILLFNWLLKNAVLTMLDNHT